jgi:hypothetical protein
MFTDNGKLPGHVGNWACCRDTREAKEGNAMNLQVVIELLIIALRIVSAGMAS